MFKGHKKWIIPNRFFNICLILIFLLVSCGNSSEQNSLQLFTNGTIYIDDTKKVENLLVENGSVKAINVSAKQLENASIVDLNGSTAYPGFIDSHAHLMESGYFIYVGANLFGCNSSDAIAKVLADKVKSVPENGTILGAGFSLKNYDNWSMEDLAKIDAVTGNRPAFLGDMLGHNAIVNSAAINLTGLTTTSRVPAGGKMGIEDGRLTGMLRESAMTLPADKIFAKFDSRDIKEGTLLLLKRWASFGYTGAVDLMGGTGVRFMRPELFSEMEREGTLPLRINYCYTIFNLSDVDEAAIFSGNDTDMVRFLGCKIFVDGAFAAGQAWTSWENLQGNHGLQEIYTDDAGGQEKNLTRIVERVEEYGMNMHYHVQGDMAIRAVLDALDKVKAKRGNLRGIHTLIHLAFPDRELMERIKEFNGSVVATVQPAFWTVENDTAYYYGSHTDQAYPIKQLIDTGISVGMSTDFSVSPLEYSPATIVTGIAVTGAGNTEVHLPLSVKEVVHSFTVGSTATTSRNDTGVLHPGYKADLVVYDRDLYSMHADKFSKESPRVLATYIGGKQIYKAQEA